MEEKKFCMKSRTELDEIRKKQASKKASVNEELEDVIVLIKKEPRKSPNDPVQRNIHTIFKSEDTNKFKADFKAGKTNFDKKDFDLQTLKDMANHIKNPQDILGTDYKNKLKTYLVNNPDDASLIPTELIESKIRKSSKKASMNEAKQMTNKDIRAAFGTLICLPNGNGELTQYLDRYAYNAGTFGWNYDVFISPEDYSVGIVTGYRVPNSMCDFKISYDDMAQAEDEVSALDVRGEEKAKAVNDILMGLLNKTTGGVSESKINEISNETVNNAFTKLDAEFDKEAIKWGVKPYKKGVSKSFDKAFDRYERFGKLNKKRLERKDKSESLTASKALTMSKSILDEISDELADKVYQKRNVNQIQAKQKAMDMVMDKNASVSDVNKALDDSDIADEKKARNVDLYYSRIARKHYANKNESKINEEKIQPSEIYDLAVANLPAEDIDHHQSDLYIRKTPESTALIKQMGDQAMLSTFRDNIDGDIWYDLPFCYKPHWDKSESKINEEDVVWHEKTFDGTKEGITLTPEQARQLENMMFKVYNIINVIESLDDNELGNLAGIQSQQGFNITGHDLIDFFKVELGLDIE